MNAEYYTALYSFQDAVLETVFEEPLGFYLTGGTALSRFYLHHRYSDDLDFFNHDLHVFPEAFRLVHEKLREKWPLLTVEVDARDFKRLRLDQGGLELKLDFVADRLPRVGMPVRVGNLSIDTVRNILANKVCAILGRDEGRDIADIICISRERRFSWLEVLAEAEKKESFSIEDLVYRLSTFPLSALAEVPFATELGMRDYEVALEGIRSDIGARRGNSLAREDAPEL